MPMARSDEAHLMKVGALVARTLQLPPDVTIAAETRLHGRGLGLDSLDALRLIAALEEEFDVTIDDGHLTPAAFESVGSIAALVRRLT